MPKNKDKNTALKTGEAAQAESKKTETSPQAESPEKAGNTEHAEEAVKTAAKVERHAAAREARSHFLSLLSSKALFDNPVLMRILAVCTVLGATTALKNGLLLSVAAAAVTIPLYLIMALFPKKVHSYLYFAAAMLIAGAIVTPVQLLANYLAPNVTEACGYFLPITAVNAVLMLDLRVLRGEQRVLRALSAGIGDVLGFSVVVIAVSALREVIGAGSLYGKVIPNFSSFRFDFVLMPPGAFLLLGLVLAIVQGVRLHTGGHDHSGEAR